MTHYSSKIFISSLHNEIYSQKSADKEKEEKETR